MDIVRVKLFNSPRILKNNEQIYFSYKKSEALLYYILVNKEATRDELVNIFWGEVEENSAKKNLRNALYQIRKTLDMDIIVSPQKSMVILNPNINVEIDVDMFLENEAMEYEEFLKGFRIRDGEEFEAWVVDQREEYKEIYILRLHHKVKDLLNKKEYFSAEKYVKALIQEDEFDEKGYRMLMDIYSRQGVFNKVIDLYSKLSHLLEKELGIMPDAKTKKLYKEILEKRNQKEEENKNKYEDFFYGREKEIHILKSNQEAFLNKNSGRSILIIGEAGIGKTRLKDRFLEIINKEEIYLVEVNCYQAEEEYILKPWNSIFSILAQIIKIENIDIPLLWKNFINYIFPVFDLEEKSLHINPIENIDTLKYQAIEDVIISLLKKLSQKKKLLFVLDDLQWMDGMSLSILERLILHEKENNIIFIGTLRNGYKEKIDKFLLSLGKYNKIEKIELIRFTKKEVEEFSSLVLPKYTISENINKKIYEESEGNTFFLLEILNVLRENGNMDFMSSKMKDILKSRFIDISQEGRKILNISSLFFDAFTLNILKLITGKDELEIIDIIEELENKFIIREVKNEEEIKFEFTHQKLREYIYRNQSLGRRKILHNKIGLLLEENLKNHATDAMIYSKLIYHFSNGGNKVKTLEYTIKNAKLYLDLTHELFPIESKKSISISKGNMDEGNIEEYFKDMENLLTNMENKEDIENTKLYMLFFHMKGRYLIREGEYEKGIRYIQDIIKKALDIKDYYFALKGYRQMIYYCIQTYDISLMKKYTKEGLEMAKKKNFEDEVGIFLRLKGLSEIMSGEYEEGEKFLKESIYIFLDKEDKYILNIAAAYNYIGEIRRHKKQFVDALDYYEKAIGICNDKKIIRGIALFHTNAGQAAFDKGEHKKAKDYFEKALGLYEKIDSLWGRAISSGYMSLLSIKEDAYHEGIQYLKEADKYSKKLKSPYEQGIVYRVKAEIKKEMDNNQNLYTIFSPYLDLSMKEYCYRGVELLKKVKGCYEIEILKKLEEN